MIHRQTRRDGCGDRQPFADQTRTKTDSAAIELLRFVGVWDPCLLFPCRAGFVQGFSLLAVYSFARVPHIDEECAHGWRKHGFPANIDDRPNDFGLARMVAITNGRSVRWSTINT